MTLEDLEQRCKNAKIKYAYGKFIEEVEPPHLVAICQESNNFYADNKVYYKQNAIQLDYTFKRKNIQEQEKIENVILSGITWTSTGETYLENEDVWQISYFFEIE